MTFARHRTDSLTALRRLAMEAPMLDATTERELIRRYRTGGSSAALSSIVSSHLRLVLAIARKFAGHGVPMEDLVSEGNLGLVQAAERFDLARDTRFAVYAAWWIRAYIRRYTLSNRRIVALPSTRNARRVLAGLRKTERELTQIQGSPASKDDVAAALGVPTEDVRMMEGALGGRDVPLGPVTDGVGHEVVDRSPSPEDEASEAEARQRNSVAVLNALRTLDAREREIVQRRILEDDGATLAVLGSSLGLSRERVRQLETRAQKKLRNALLDLVA